VRLVDIVRGAVRGLGLSSVGWTAEKDAPLDIAESSSMAEEDPSDGRDIAPQLVRYGIWL
jgi:hypothetical protein